MGGAGGQSTALGNSAEVAPMQIDLTKLIRCRLVVVVVVVPVGLVVVVVVVVVILVVAKVVVLVVAVREVLEEWGAGKVIAAEVVEQQC